MKWKSDRNRRRDTVNHIIPNYLPVYFSFPPSPCNELVMSKYHYYSDLPIKITTKSIVTQNKAETQSARHQMEKETKGNVQELLYVF